MKWTKTPIGEISCIVKEDYMTFEELEKLIPKNARMMTCVRAMQLLEEKEDYFKGFENIRYFVKSNKYKNVCCWPIGRGGSIWFYVFVFDRSSRGVLIVKKKGKQ